MNQQMLDRFNQTHGVDLIAAVRRRGQVLAIGEGLMPKERYISQGARFDDVGPRVLGALGLQQPGGPAEAGARARRRDGADDSEARAEPRRRLLLSGRAATGRVFATWDEFAAWKQAHGKARPGAPRVALGFYKSSYYSGETELLDAVIAEIEKRGGEAIPFFGYPEAAGHASGCSLDAQGAPRADVVLSLLFRFAGPEATTMLEKVDIPLINLISLYGRSEQEWRASSTGPVVLRGHVPGGRAGAGGPGRADRDRQPGEGEGRRDRADDGRAQADRVAGDDGRAARASSTRRCAARRTATSGWRSSSTTTPPARRTSAPAI